MQWTQHRDKNKPPSVCQQVRGKHYGNTQGNNGHNIWISIITAYGWSTSARETLWKTPTLDFRGLDIRALDLGGGLEWMYLFRTIYRTKAFVADFNQSRANHVPITSTCLCGLGQQTFRKNANWSFHIRIGACK